MPPVMAPDGDHAPRPSARRSSGSTAPSCSTPGTLVRKIISRDPAARGHGQRGVIGVDVVAAARRQPSEMGETTGVKPARQQVLQAGGIDLRDLAHAAQVAARDGASLLAHSRPASTPLRPRARTPRLHQPRHQALVDRAREHHLGDLTGCPRRSRAGPRQSAACRPRRCCSAAISLPPPWTITSGRRSRASGARALTRVQHGAVLQLGAADLDRQGSVVMHAPPATLGDQAHASRPGRT